MIKRCTKCDLHLPIDSFGKCSRNSDGKLERCKTCYNSYMREFYKKNPEKIKSRAAKYFQENREVQNQNRKVFYLNNFQRHADNSKKWAENNPIKIRAIKAANRAKRNKAPRYLVTSKEIEQMISKPCFYCNQSGSSHLDHIVPLSRGGSHSIGNLIGACAKCNLTKNAKTIMEWRLYKIRTNSCLRSQTS